MGLPCYVLEISPTVLLATTIGPLGFAIITNSGEIAAMGELGVAFLLFVVGLEIDFKKIRNVGVVSAVGAGIQMVLTFLISFFLVGVIGFGLIESIYIGLIASFSSTMIATKLLVDRRELETIHARIMLGVLIIQDILVVLAMPMLDTINTSVTMNIFGDILFKGLGLFFIGFILNKFVFHKVIDHIANNKEVLFLVSVATAFGFIGLSHFLGFSIAVGAFIAGLAIASFPYNLEVINEVSSLKHFFSTIFFTTLGMQLNLLVIYNMFIPFVVILIILILIKPIILTVSYLFLGYGGRVSAAIGLGLGQASEFSFILALQGLNLGHLSQDMYSLMISIVVISMVLTPYFFMGRNRIYNFAASFRSQKLEWFLTPRSIKKIEKQPNDMKNHTVIFGCGVSGREIIKHADNKNLLIVDHDPEIIRKLGKSHIHCLYGDVTNDELLIRGNIKKAKYAVLTIPSAEVSSLLIRKLKRLNSKIEIFARAESENQAKDLRKLGAKHVIVPRRITGHEFVKELKSAKNKLFNKKQSSN